MYCSRCTAYTPVTQNRLNLQRYKIRGEILRLDCDICQNFVALVDDGDVVSVDERYDEIMENGWKKVRTNREKIYYYILSQIIYPENDTPCVEKFESLYDYADDFDDVILRWKNGRPVAFYTIKLKGTEIYTTNYSMPTIDTAYVRSKYRNQGIGSEILTDVIGRFPIDDIAFSKPISNGMLKVLRRFLTERKEYRLRFWETEDGDEGSQKLVWFLLRNEK